MVHLTVEGLIAPVFTPVHEDGRLNVDIVPEYARHLSSNHVDGVLVSGTTGEITSFSVQERKEHLEAWITEAKPLGFKVIAQVGGVTLPDVLDLARHAEHMQSDAILTLPELYFKPKTTEQLVTYLEQVSGAAPSLPLLYYHFPMMSGVEVNIPELFKLASARIPAFKGVKADLGVALQVDDLLQDDQKVFIANHFLAPATFMGHDSAIATVVNMFPGLVRDVVRSTKAGDLARARELQKQLHRRVTAIVSQGEFGPSMKTAMALVSGVRVGPPRAPQAPLTTAGAARLARDLQVLGVPLAQTTTV